MAKNAPMSREAIDSDGAKLVRRFTNELNGENQLEISIKDAQSNEDELKKAAYNERVRRLTYDFNAAEITRKKLREMCERMDAKIRGKRMSNLARFFRRSETAAKQKAVDMMRNSVAYDFFQLRTMVQEQENLWKSTQGRVSKNFMALCRSLDANKAVFNVFPQQNVHSAVFCGSVALLVHAAMNHNTVAETLSQAVMRVSIKASECSSIVDLVNTQAARHQLSSIYAQVFDFYCDAIEWFASPKYFNNSTTPSTKDSKKPRKTLGKYTSP
ncbi:hypothetical protein BS50DRAFT_583225 [Corynespora cassiicola Philippines]|uniref:DUF7708 domain-containing protein n=1 Tax=Corynespora cassiicola Philippines TaxID=1448308 RepID=A0A2T2P7T1_CORCC|nr:hypothetical protein BS50DRAFT_583225 [Corynespora cassiicola Philippines]